MDKTAQTKMQFLKISPSARAAALGDAFSTVAGDPNSIFYNPAGMAFVDGINVAINKNDWIADIAHLSAVISYNNPRYGTFSFNAITMDYGEFQRTRIDDHAWLGYEVLGTFDVAEYSLGFGYANNITDRFALGGQVKYINQNLGQVEAWSNIGTEFEHSSSLDYKDNVVAYDLGTYYETGYNGIIIAMSVQNFANSPIPLIFRYGMAVELNQLLFPSVQDHSLRLNGDLSQTKDYGDGYQVGLEYAYNKKLFLRTGYKLNFSEENFTCGAGLNLPLKDFNFVLDYAYTKLDFLGSVNRITIGVRY